ncbi:MAG: hypothetical protein IKW90_09625 [Lachnospiraceae bacterium]|nr:hypothetical protein [Lachnospiraceae bacterium]
MGKDRKAHEIVGELMERYNINEKAFAERAGVSELVVLNYLSGLNKDSRNYARLKSKVKAAFELEDEFFSEEHVWTPKPVPEAVKEEKKEKPAKQAKPKKKKAYSDIAQLFFNQKGQISEEPVKEGQIPEKEVVKPAVDTNIPSVENEAPEKKSSVKKQQAAPQDPLMSAIKLSGSKAKLSGKKKDITPEDASRWVGEYEEEIKHSVGRAFEVLRESLKENFTKEETKPVYTNKKIAELVELASKAKDEDLALVITMLKKLIK